LIFVAAPVDAVQFGRPDDMQEQWQECRTAVGRPDITLVDLRKYGFGLASLLLTAGAILGGIRHPSQAQQYAPSGTSEAGEPPGEGRGGPHLEEEQISCYLKADCGTSPLGASSRSLQTRPYRRPCPEHPHPR
jgi:hypothetical protein